MGEGLTCGTYLGSLAGSLGGELLARSFTSGGLPGGLLWIEWTEGMVSMIILIFEER
jgi:hypothetical protein